MKNQYSYYFHRLLHDCITICKENNHPTLLVGETIKLLQEYANDCADTIERVDLLDSMESMIGWAETYQRHVIEKEWNDMLLTPLTIDIDNAKSSLDDYKKTYKITEK